MKVEKSYCSKAVKFFQSKFNENYGLKEIDNHTDSVVMFGMYDNADYDFAKNHKGKVKVVWCGSDAMRIRRVQELRNYEHIAMSSFISDDLKKHGINHSIIPVNPSSININLEPRGDHIYHYGGGEFYGEQYIEEIEQRTGLKVIHTSAKEFSRSELMLIYKACFIGLRLTKHDGLPNTVIELALMGRRSIYNGELPNCIKWQGIDDICESIIEEYKRKDEDNNYIHQDMINYLKISNDWLDL
jgi:predicted CoA-binding protein